jgi:hypothetical protein
MSTRAASLLCLVATLALPGVASAQSPPIKPGLWEVKNSLGLPGQAAAPAGDQLKGLPPEARAKVEEMMKAKGIAMGADGTTRLCFTRESLDAGHWQQASRCKTDYSSRSNASWKWRSVCSAPESVSDGEAVFANPENYTVKTTTTSTFRGEARTTAITIKARWVAASCGDLKPFDPKR